MNILFFMAEERKNANRRIKQKTRYDERVILSEKLTCYFLLHVYCEMNIKVLGFESSYLSWLK